MARSVDQGYFEVEQRESGKNTFFLGKLEALLNRRPEFLGHVSTNNLRFEFESFTTWLERLDDVVDLTELTGTTGLLLVSVGVFDTLRDRLAVGNLRLRPLPLRRCEFA